MPIPSRRKWALKNAIDEAHTEVIHRISKNLRLDGTNLYKELFGSTKLFNVTVDPNEKLAALFAFTKLFNVTADPNGRLSPTPITKVLKIGLPEESDRQSIKVPFMAKFTGGSETVAPRSREPGLVFTHLVYISIPISEKVYPLTLVRRKVDSDGPIDTPFIEVTDNYGAGIRITTETLCASRPVEHPPDIEISEALMEGWLPEYELSEERQAKDVLLLCRAALVGAYGSEAMEALDRVGNIGWKLRKIGDRFHSWLNSHDGPRSIGAVFKLVPEVSVFCSGSRWDVKHVGVTRMAKPPSPSLKEAISLLASLKSAEK